jgi:MFS family permease
MKKLTLITSIGAGLEYYDFVIYALLASYISVNFFPHADASVSLVQTFAVFAIGYLARPIGGLLFGLLGDRKGRKHAFLTSIILMAISTLGIGLLPSYHTVGYTASIGLLLLRIMQGIAFGAEIPGAVTFLTEHSSRQRRGLHSGFMVGSLALCAGLGSLLIMLLSYQLSKEQMLNWGWRIPFLLGSLVALVGIWLRRKIEETPLFLKHNQSKVKTAILSELFKHHLLALVQGFGIILFTASLIIFGLSLPSHLHQYYGYDLPATYRANSIGLFWSALMLPLFGLLSDKIGRRKQICITTLAFAVLAQFIFHLLNFNNELALIGFILIYQTIIAATAACYIPMLAELFPTPVRFTGIAVCYNLGGSISGLTPLFTTELIRLTGEFCYVIYYFSALALLTFFTALSINYRHQKPLD